MNLIVNKQKLVDLVYTKLSKEISKDEIRAVVSIIITWMIETLKDGQPVTISRFGTFSIYLYKGHEAANVKNLEKIKTRDLLSIRFIPSDMFQKFLENKKKLFK